MRHFSSNLICIPSFVLGIFFGALNANAQQLDREPSAKISALDAFAQRPLSFLENKGQWDKHAKYLLQSDNVNLWITDSGIVYDIYDVRHSVPIERRLHCSSMQFKDLNDTITRTGHIVRMSFQNTTHSNIEASNPQPGTTNWFIGNDSTKWATGARTFGDVKITNLYEGIDLVFYLDHGTPRYDLVLKPGADPKQIAMKFQGQDALMSDGSDGLRIKTSMGDIEECGLFAYQIIDGQRLQVPCGFDIASNGSTAFNIGAYDGTRPLVIDPLLYSTCLGGNKDEVVQGMGLAVDASGNAYATGGTYSSGVYPTGYPITTGAYQTSNNGASDIFVTKLNPSGSALVYSTYIGGSANDWSMGITVDGQGNAVVVGFTSSHDSFPTTAGSYSPTYRASTIVTKLNATGTGLIFSTFVGADEANAIAIDSAGNVYIAGRSTTDLVTTLGAFQTTPNSRWDAFVSKLSASGSSLLYSTFLGGSGDDAAMGIAVNTAGEAFVTGRTQSFGTYPSGFPTTPGAFQTTPLNSTIDTFGGSAFVAKLNASGSSLLYSTYLSGTRPSEAAGIVIDPSGNAYVAGQAGRGFTTTPGAYQMSSNSDFTMFASKLNPTGSALLYSTYLGGSSASERSIFTGGIGVDAFGNTFITGTTLGNGRPTTPDAFQQNNNGRDDAVLVKLNAAGNNILYATYLGGGDLDEGECIAVDRFGNAYIGGFTTSIGTPPIGFPTTKGAFQTVNHGTKGDAFVAKFSFSIPTLSAQADSVSAPYCGNTNVLCTLANGSGGVLTVDSVSVQQPFSPSPGQFPVQLQKDSTGHITIQFLPLTGGVYTSPMTIHYRTPDGASHDTIVILTAQSSSGSGDLASCKSIGRKTVTPLSIVDLPVNPVLATVRSLDTMQIDEIDFSVSFDSNLLSMDPRRFSSTILPPSGLTFASASIEPGRLNVSLLNPAHTKLANQLNLGDLLFTAYRGPARSTTVLLSKLAIVAKSNTYSYCTSVEGDFIAEVVVEGSGVAAQPSGTFVRIYPNPASKEDITIEVTSAKSCKVEASLLDLLGKEAGHVAVRTVTAGSHLFQIPASGLTPGSYYARIVIDGIAQTRKIVIR